MQMKLVVFSLLVVGAVAEVARFDNYRVYRLIPKNYEQLDALKQLESSNLYDFWRRGKKINQPVDIMVPPHLRPQFSEFIQKLQLPKSIYIENVQDLIDEEQRERTNDNGTLEWTNYHDLEVYDAWMDDLSKNYPNVKKIVAGKTYEKRNITGIEITFGANLPTVFIESNIHAREWISSAATSWVVNEIVQCSSDSAFRKYNYIYIPFFNPDGYAYSRTKNRFWRKTRTPYETDFWTCYGADPNRNWDFHWGVNGCSRDPCNEAYCGPSPFSEVETKTLSEFLRANAKAKKIDAYLAFHSYSQLIMYPWGWSPDPAPMSKQWQRIGELAAKDLAAVNNVQFNVGDIYHIIYPCSGTSLDWYYGNYNSTITFVYELRDKGQYGFVLPPRYILPSAKELYASVLRIIKEYAKLSPKY